MSENIADNPELARVETALRGELDRGNVVIATTRPILRHLLANGDQSLFSDEVLAHVRGMLAHVAQQLLHAEAGCAGEADPHAFALERQGQLAHLLLQDTAFLGHAHTLTLEARLASQIQRRSGIDPVLSPLLQELAASGDAQKARAAVRALAAQARFIQQQRRMELPLAELPGDLFRKALLLLGNREGAGLAAEQAGTTLLAAFCEADTRVSLLEALVGAMGRKAMRALAVDHAGLSIFITALAMASGQDRGLVALSFGENQLARLALALRAAGLEQDAVEEQLLYLQPQAALPQGFAALTADRAARLLSVAQPETLG